MLERRINDARPKSAEADCSNDLQATHAGSEAVPAADAWRPTVSKSLRNQLRSELKDCTYRRFRCTGSQCGFEGIFLDGWQPTCPTSDCRGTMTPRRVVPLKSVIDQTLRWIEYRQSTSNSPVEGPFHGVSASEKAQEFGNELVLEPSNPRASGEEIHLHANSAGDCPTQSAGGRV